MLSRAQQIHLKRAQKEALLDDAEYREAIATVSGHADCRSSTDARLTDRNMDNLMAYFEAIYWGKVDAQTLLPGRCKGNAVFQQRGYWASKNPRNNTSRDRFAESNIQSSITDLEAELAAMGCGLAYCRAIQNRMRAGGGSFKLVNYRAALKRTLAAKQRAAEKVVDRPF